MIESLVGALVKAPEVSKYQNVEGKTSIVMTINEKRRSSKGSDSKVYFYANVNVLAQSDAQKDFYLALPKGKVVSFGGVQLQSVKEGDKDAETQNNNINVSASVVTPYGYDEQDGGQSSKPAQTTASAGNRGNRPTTPAKPAVKSKAELEDSDPFAGDDDEDIFDN